MKCEGGNDISWEAMQEGTDLLFGRNKIFRLGWPLNTELFHS